MLWLLGLIPVLIIGYIMWKRWRTKSISMIDKTVLESVFPDLSGVRPFMKWMITTIAIALIIVGIANPQIGSKMEEVKRTGVDVMICLDLSNSMLAEDLSPNRLERAKRGISQMIDKLRNDRIGIVVFGGQAYVQLPITTDYAAAKLFLSTISTDIIPTQGTAIGAAIDLAVESFDMKSPTGKSIIVITDGENHEDDAVSSAKAAVEKGITVHTIGMGSAQGAPLPSYRGSVKTGYRKDKEGNTIVSKLNEEMLTQISSAGNGTYVRASNANSGLDFILDELNKMEKVEYDSKVFTDYEDRFQYFLFAGFVLLVIEYLVFGKKPDWAKKLNLFGEK